MLFFTVFSYVAGYVAVMFLAFSVSTLVACCAGPRRASLGVERLVSDYVHPSVHVRADVPTLRQCAACTTLLIWQRSTQARRARA